MKHVKWDQVLIPGCLNVPEGALKGSLGRGVPQKPSKSDPLSHKNCSFGHPV